MTKLSQFFSLFPALVVGLASAAAYRLVAAPSLGSALLLLAVLYAFPLAVYRLHSQFFPIRPGVSYLGGADYSPWWGSHQIQWVYVAFPALEAALRAVPGLFSLWLRAWGSEVGAGVYWTPQIEIADRGLLRVGDGVIFGHRCGLYPHVVTPRRDDAMLFVSVITLGAGCFLGADSVLGPGVRVDPGVFLPAGSRIKPREHVTE